MLCQSSEKTWSWLGNKTQTFGSSLDNDVCVFKYNQCEKRLEKIFGNISEGVRVRSGCQWNEEGEKSAKYFLNDEKLHGLPGKIHEIIADSKEITSNSEIRKEFRSYYKAFFKNHNSNHFSIMKSFLTKLIFQSFILVTRIYLNLNFIWHF